MKDSAFIRDKVPMTKEEVRAIVLGKLELYRAKRLLDIGAGTGSVSIEAKLSFPHLEVTAIERHDYAVDLIVKNCEKFQLTMEVLRAKAPQVNLTKSYDRFFIGGSGGNLKEIIAWLMANCLPESIAVFTFITLEQFFDAMKVLDEHKLQYEVSQVHVSKSEALGSFTYLKPNNPTFIISTTLKGVRHE